MNYYEHLIVILELSIYMPVSKRSFMYFSRQYACD